MHTALTPKRALVGIKEQPSAILNHGGKLYVGTTSGSLLVYALTQDEPQEGAASVPLEEVKLFSPRGRPIEKLSVAKELGALISLSDNVISLHGIADLSPMRPSPLPQTKGALTFNLDTSVQRRPKLNIDASAGAGTIGQGTLRRGQAWRIGGATLKSGGANTTKIAASLRDMSAIAKEKEEKRKALRQGLANEEQRADEDTEMTLVTILVVGLRRKLQVFRWVDGQFWDTKELSLPHTPRSLAFPSPTSLFIGYSLAEYASLKIPFAADSSVTWLHRQDTVSAVREIPESSSSGKYVDVVEWETPREVSVPSLPVGASTSAAADTSTSGAPAGYGAALGAAFGSLGGYVGMSGTRQKDPRVIATDDQEVLVARENTGVLVGSDGSLSRKASIEWPITPDTTFYLRPFIVSLLPPMSGASTFASKLSFGGGAAATSEVETPAIQVLSSSTLAEVQLLRLPIEKTPHSISVPSLSAGPKPPILLCSAPTDRATLEKDGVTVWRLEMERWDVQVEELVKKGGFDEAIALLDSIDQVFLEDKDQRRARIQALRAVNLFSREKFEEAIEIFLSLDTNPAQVLTLYPSSISGELSRPRKQWYKVFGAEEEYEMPEPSVSKSKESQQDPDSSVEGGVSGSLSPVKGSPRAMPAIPREKSRLGSLLVGRRPQSFYAENADSQGASVLGTSPSSVLASSPSKIGKAPIKSLLPDDDSKSIHSVTSGKAPAKEKESTKDDVHRKSLDALGKFLADRRRIFKPILESHPESHIAQTKSQEDLDVDAMLAIPSVPLGELSLDQLANIAQAVDTALLKTFLETKPALIGSLCRLENWCKVEQVEQLLMESKKFSELIALYGGKNMHMKALDLLRKFGEEEDDVEEKLGPTVRYLQNLDAEHIDVILKASHWVLEVDPEMGLEIFTADTGKVSSLPRIAIVQDLEAFSPILCIRYLEYIISNFGESDPSLHEKLLFLYLRRATELGEAGDQDERRTYLKKLLAFLEVSRQYDAERVLGRLPPRQEDLYEIRAVLLGRMGQHDAALSIYVHVLGDISQAEAYCNRVWSSKETTEDHQVFLTFIKVLLRPEQTRAAAVLRSAPDQAKEQAASLDAMKEALGIIARHGSRIDAVAVLDMLPPLVSMQSIDAFASRVLQVTSAERHDAQVLSCIYKARDHQLDHGLAALSNRSIKITEDRLCARCKKRLGNSAGITVNPITGSTTHFFCREDANAVDEVTSRRMRLQDLYL